MSSGPLLRAREIHLPDLQPGSSIMPGKVNPVVPEAVCQVVAQVIGNDAAVAFGGASGNFELNIMLPVMGRELCSESIRLVAAASAAASPRSAWLGSRPTRRDVATTRSPRPRSPPPSTHTSATRTRPRSKRGWAQGKELRLVFLEMGLLGEDEVDRALDAWR